MPPLAPMLPDELLEEIFLRLPPDEPECLVASKLWLAHLTTPRFDDRYREFHRSTPMLGFFNSDPYINDEPPFVSTTKFRIPDPGNMWYSGTDSGFDAWDCRHGRVLLGGSHASTMELAVLDPITSCRRELVAPGFYSRFAAGVLCAINGCDHRACRGGPSRVVFVGLRLTNAVDFVAYAHVSLPETGESMPHSHLRQWSKPSSGLHLGHDASIQLVPPVFIHDALYFNLAYDDDDHVGILKYDLCFKCLSLIDAPLQADDIADITILMGMEDGSLGFAHLDGITLNLWSRQIGSDGFGSWTECRVIDLNQFLPVPKKSRLRPIGSVEGCDIIFVTMKLGIYKINLKSLEWKNIWKKENFSTLLPYMSFYYPQGRANPCDTDVAY